MPFSGTGLAEIALQDLCNQRIKYPELVLKAMNRTSTFETKVKSACVALLAPKLKDLAVDGEALAQFVVKNFCAVPSPPEAGSGIAEFSLIKRRGAHRDSASSIKPFNLIVNWKGLILVSPGLMTTALGAGSSLHLVCLGLLTLCCQLGQIAEVKLSMDHVQMCQVIASRQPVSYAEMLAEGIDAHTIEDLLAWKVVQMTNGNLQMIEEIQL